MRRKTYGLTKEKAEIISKNTEVSYKNKYKCEKYVCVICLKSYLVDSYIEEDGIPTSYYLENWNMKGNTVRVCYDCFTYG